MTNQQEIIWQFLKSNALGHEKALHYPPIAAIIGVECEGSNCQNIRSIIKEMVELYALPIGTSQNGVFVIISEDDMQIAVKWVERSNRGDYIRKNGIYTGE